MPNMRVKISNLPADYDMKLYHPLGLLLGTAQTRGNTDETIIYNPSSLFLNVGTFRVYVYGYNGVYNSSQCYTIRVDLSATDFAVNSSVNLPSVNARNAETPVPAEQVTVAEDIKTIRMGEMKIYPVPASSMVNVSFDAFAKGNVTISISDQLGHQVLMKTVNVEDGINITSMNVSALSPGIYSVRVNNGNTVQVKKLVIAR
jgi:type IX secretion system substrate protein